MAVKRKTTAVWLLLSIAICAISLAALWAQPTMVTAAGSAVTTPTPTGPSVYLPRLLKPLPWDCPDPHEPNGTFGQAIPICEEPIQSYVCAPDDVDLFITCGGSLVDFLVDLYDLPADYDLYVYDGQTEIGRSTNPGTRAERVYVYIGSRTNNSYYVKVIGAGGAFDVTRPYTLRFVRNPGLATPTPTNTPIPGTPTETATPSPTGVVSTATPTLTPPPGPSLAVDPVISPTSLLVQMITGLTDPGVSVYVQCETGRYVSRSTDDGHFAVEIYLLERATTHLTVTAVSNADPSARTVTTVDRNGNPLAITHAPPTSSPTATATQTPTLTATGTATAKPTGTFTSSPTRTNTPTPSPSATPTHTLRPSMTPTLTMTPTPTPPPSFRVLVPGEVTRGIQFDMYVALMDFRGYLVTNYRGTIHISTINVPVVLPATYTFTAEDGGIHRFAALVTAVENESGRIRVEDRENGFVGTSEPFYVRPAPATATATPTVTSTPTWTPTQTLVPSPTPTATPSATPTASVTTTATFTMPPTSTRTATPSLTVPPTSTGTATPTTTPTRTATSPGGPFTRVFQQGVDDYHGTEDTTLNAWYPDRTHAYEQTLVLAVREHPQEMLIRFDLSSLPPYVTVLEATLELYAHADSDDKPMTMHGYRVLRSWNVQEATWNQASTGVPWSVPGGNGAGTDREATPSLTHRLTRDDDWVSFEVTALVQTWVRQPETNHGLLFKGESSAVVQYYFDSAEYWGTARRPRLLVTYQILPTPTATLSPTPTPSPTPSPTATRTPTLVLRSVVLQQGVAGYTGTTDASISSWDPDGNAGNAAEMAVRATNQKSVLVRFDLPMIPAGARIYDAKLQLYVLDGAHELTVKAYSVLRPWNESQVTWRSPRSGELWGNPGCDAVGIDRDVLPVATATLSQPNVWAELLMTDLVASWVNDPATNYGVLLKATGAVATEYRLASSEHWKMDWRPKLTILYGVP